MRVDPHHGEGIGSDDWLEGQCRALQAAGRELAMVVGQINERLEQERTGRLGRRRVVTETHLRQVEAACRIFHDVQISIQNGLFDCEHELRALREREVSPAELLVDGERLIRQYRFLRRRARVMDGLLAYLPGVSSYAAACLDVVHHLHEEHEIEEIPGPLMVPDCGFALVALEELRDDSPG